MKSMRVKKVKAGVRKGNVNGGVRKPVMSGPTSALDKDAKAWIRLLEDPCNAPMVQPCYPGTGTGYFSRCRYELNVPAEARDWIFEFHPGTSVNGTSLGAWSWSNTSGGALGNATADSMGGFIASGAVGRYRAVAACLQVVYTGSELNRSGVVGVSSDQGVTFVNTQPIGATVPQYMTTMAHTERLGQRAIEYRWVPGPGDELFSAAGGTGEELTSTSVGSSMTLAINNMYPGSTKVYAVVVWEWQPAQEILQGMIPQAKLPSSANNLNQVLHAIGDVGKFMVNASTRAAAFIAANGTTLATIGRALTVL